MSSIVEARQNMLQSMANWLAQLKPTHHPLYRKGVEEVIAAAFNGYRTDKGQPGPCATAAVFMDAVRYADR